MGYVNLENIKIKKLEEISVEGGNVIKGIKLSDANFYGFGEVYFSIINNKFIKAWKKHKKITMNLVVIRGTVKFVFSSENQSFFREEILNQDDFSIITIPPNVWFGFQGLCEPDSLIMNCASIEHDPNEVERLDKKLIKYKW